MKFMHVGSHTLRLRWLRAVFCCGLLQATMAQADVIDLTEDLPGVQGVALDGVNSRLLFFQKQNTTANALWDLMSLQLSPGCKTGRISCTAPVIVATGFYRPFQIALSADATIAYVIQANNNNNASFYDSLLLRVDLKSGGLKQMAELSLPGQIAMAPEINALYLTQTNPLCTFGSGDPCPIGWISRLDLTSGAGAILTEGPAPFALVHTNDHERAYVTQSGQVVEIDLSTGKPTRTVASISQHIHGGFLAWADATERALYLLETDENFNLNKVFQIDLATSQKTLVADNLGESASGIAVDPSGDSLYLSLSSKIVRIPLAIVSPTRDVFLSVGRVPVTSIDTDGYANSQPGDPIQVVDAPFGGTLDIFGNLTNFLKNNAATYSVSVSRDGGPSTPILTSWTELHWNGIRFEPFVIAPIPGTARYAIPKEYSRPATVPFWSPPYRMLRWQTSEKGKYEIKVEIFSLSGNDITGRLPKDQNSLVLQIDNLPPAVDLTNILVSTGTEYKAVEPCTIIRSPVKNAFRFKLTAYDPHGHLLGYNLSALWGRNQSGMVLSDSYQLNENGPHLWMGSKEGILPDDQFWSAGCNCAHTFILDAWKRTIDGYSYILRGTSRQSVTIDNTNAACTGL